MVQTFQVNLASLMLVRRQRDRSASTFRPTDQAIWD